MNEHNHLISINFISSFFNYLLIMLTCDANVLRVCAHMCVCVFVTGCDDRHIFNTNVEEHFSILWLLMK